MRYMFVLAAVALAGCQPEAKNVVAPAPEKPMGEGPLQDREFTRPLLGIVKIAAAEAVLKLDSAKNQVYFGTNVNGKTIQSVLPFVAPELRNTAGRAENAEYLIQYSRFDCKSDVKALGTSTIVATVSRKNAPNTAYHLCMVADWPKDTRLPGWANKAP